MNSDELFERKQQYLEEARQRRKIETEKNNEEWIEFFRLKLKEWYGQPDQYCNISVFDPQAPKNNFVVTDEEFAKELMLKALIPVGQHTKWCIETIRNVDQYSFRVSVIQVD